MAKSALCVSVCVCVCLSVCLLCVLYGPLRSSVKKKEEEVTTQTTEG